MIVETRNRKDLRSLCSGGHDSDQATTVNRYMARLYICRSGLQRRIHAKRFHTERSVRDATTGLIQEERYCLETSQSAIRTR